MDRNSSIEQFGLGSNEQSSLIDDTESMGDWDAPYQCNTAKGKEMIKTKEFIYYRMKTEGKSESNLAARLFLKLKDKRRDKVVVRKLLVIIKGEVYHVKFIVNPNEGDSTPGIVLGMSFLKTSRGIIDLGKGVMTIYPDLDPFHDNSNSSDDPGDEWDDLLEKISILGTYLRLMNYRHLCVTWERILEIREK
ncbi:reverse transcriptase domain-containing protein [Tanacetum coccineum]